MSISRYYLLCPVKNTFILADCCYQDLKELEKAWPSNSRLTAYKKYLQAFEELDKDKTGVLRPAELFEACQNLGVELSIQDAINIVNEVT